MRVMTLKLKFKQHFQIYYSYKYNNYLQLTDNKQHKQIKNKIKIKNNYKYMIEFLFWSSLIILRNREI